MNLSSYFGTLNSAVSNVYGIQCNSTRAWGTIPTVDNLHVYNGTDFTTEYSSKVFEALLIATTYKDAFNASYTGTWISQRINNVYAYWMSPDGTFSSDYDDHPRVIAPCFTIDMTKVTVTGRTITIK